MSKATSHDVAEIPLAELLCQFCDAPLAPGAQICRRCGIANQIGTANPYVSPVYSKIETESRSIGSLAMVLVSLGLLVVLFVIGVQSPGLGILLAVMMVPPWIRTALVLRRRRKSGLDTGRTTGIVMFVGSALMTWLILIVTLVSCLLTFCFACIGALTIGRNSRDLAAMVGFAPLLAAIIVILVFVPLIRMRYIRDSTKKQEGKDP